MCVTIGRVMSVCWACVGGVRAMLRGVMCVPRVLRGVLRGVPQVWPRVVRGERQAVQFGLRQGRAIG